MSDRRALRAATRAMDEATSFEAWREAAEAHDALSGALAWREDDASPHYDAGDLRTSLHTLAQTREAADQEVLAERLTEDLHRHLHALAAPELYERALAGTKQLIERYLDEVEACIGWLASHEGDGPHAAQKRIRFETASRVFGRSALVLTGGGTWGFHHLGVVQALLELDLLPEIVSGASTGAMVAAGVCGRSDDELREMFEDTSSIRLDGLVPVGIRSSLRTAAWLDPEKLYEVLLHNCGGWTFAEAHARSGRVLNISVSPTRTRQKPRLLTHLTAPEVLIARAAVASSALPGLFPPVVLHKRARDGTVVDYLPEERWVDGSLYGDVPRERLARLHNVNHFIVSQTNPVILPFVRHQPGGVRGAVSGVVNATVRAQGSLATDLARRSLRTGPVGQVFDQAHAFMQQQVRGDIDIQPRFHWANYRKVAANPTRDELARFILEGRRAVWPRAAKIRNQTRVGRALEAACAALSDRPRG